jgi:uncharacterized peroxidase-related enzyme
MAAYVTGNGAHTGRPDVLSIALWQNPAQAGGVCDREATVRGTARGGCARPDAGPRTAFEVPQAMPLLDPLPPETTPGLAAEFATFTRILGFVPNSLLTMQRKPAIVAGFEALTRAVMAPDGEVDLGFKRLVAHVCSRAAGCQYCMAHSLVAAEIHGIAPEKVDAVWSYPSSPLYSDAERVALDFALAAGSVPNAVDEPLMQRLRAHWSEGAVVELLAVVSLYGFLNRWNDSMGTPLEEPARRMGERALAAQGWTGGKHLGR